MQSIMFDNNCVWLFWKFPYFTYLTKTSWTQSTTTFEYNLRRELPTIYLFVLHQMWTLWIMTPIRSTASAHISITWKVWYFTFSNNWPWSSIFWRSKTFGFVYREDINTFTVNVKHWVFFFPVMFTNISLPLALWLTPGFVLLNVLVSDV